MKRGLPTELSARIALRTQQIIAYEIGSDEDDRSAGRIVLRRDADRRDRTRARGVFDKIDAMGGTVKAIERGYLQREIQNAAYEYQQAVDRKEAIVVGVMRSGIDEEKEIPLQRIDPTLEAKQVERLKALRLKRDQAKWKSTIQPQQPR